MRSILLGSVPIHGHITPMLPLARWLVERGDRVRFITGERWAGAVTATGATHIPLPPDADFDDRQDWNQLPGRARLHGVAAIAFDVEHIFIRPADGQYRALRAAIDDDDVDAAAVDPAFAGGAFLLSQPRRPPVVVVGIVPLTIRSRDTAPFGTGLQPPRTRLGRAQNTALMGLLDRTLLKRPQRLTSEIHEAVVGKPLGFPVFDWPRYADAIAQCTVPEFEYPRSDAPSTLRFTGPMFGRPSAAPLPTWWPDLDGRQVIHVTQGTAANQDYRQIIAPTLEALADEDMLVVVATGGRPLDTLPPLPANARAAEYLPYDDLLPRTDLFVTNSGYGGIHYALRYGIPIVCTTGKEDKPEISARVAWSGVGVRLSSETPTAKAVRRAVRRVLADGRYQARAQQMAQLIAATDGAAGVGAILDEVAGW